MLLFIILRAAGASQRLAGDLLVCGPVEVSGQGEEVGAGPGLMTGGCIYDVSAAGEVVAGAGGTGEGCVIDKGVADESGVESGWEE